MVITALNRYYEILKDDEKTDIPLSGYSKAKVVACLIISKDGELMDVMSLKVASENGKKLVPRVMTVPEQVIRSANIASNFACDTAKYILGIDKDEKVYPKHFDCFRSLHQNILKNAVGIKANALLRFAEKWDVSTAFYQPVIQANLETVFDNGNLVFVIDGEPGFVHENEEINKLWKNYAASGTDDLMGQCLILGENTAISRLHPNIKGVKDAQPSGASLVSFNAPAYESYGKTQSYNSPVGKYPAFCYTAVLNHMLASRKQKIQIGDATTVFWAESTNDSYTDCMSQFFAPTITEDNSNDQQDKRAEKLVKDILFRAKTGQLIGNFDDDLKPDTKCYILGLSPNASRISIRFFHMDSFGDFVQKAAQHYCDMSIVKEFDNNRDNIPIWNILNELVPPKSSVKSPPPLIAGAVMRAIISGGLYPASLYNAILERVKVDCDIRVNFIRASVIKAYLLRKSRLTGNYLKGVVTVALNEQSTDTAYLLGRLFAILEKTQRDSGNETLKARYFTSACTTPGATFPILLRLAQHHIAKMEYGFSYDKKIEAIVDQIRCFPAHLSLEQQGVFMLGYYQQRVKLWEKQSKNIGGTENEQQDSKQI